jgi:hypothetical protein
MGDLRSEERERGGQVDATAAQEHHR